MGYLGLFVFGFFFSFKLEGQFAMAEVIRSFGGVAGPVDAEPAGALVPVL